jgi:NADP-dependent 3-hydroxy acid dehydrogenase YdfG
MARVDNQVAIITGAANGIGRAIAREDSKNKSPFAHQG